MPKPNALHGKEDLGGGGRGISSSSGSGKAPGPVEEEVEPPEV